MRHFWRALWRRLRPMHVTIGMTTAHPHTMRADDLLAIWRVLREVAERDGQL